jgi:HSP20 family molecular chaperone IbpA
MRDVDPEDIDISVIGDKLTIRGAIRAEAEVANGISMLTVPRAKVVKPKAIKVKTK